MEGDKVVVNGGGQGCCQWRRTRMKLAQGHQDGVETMRSQTWPTKMPRPTWTIGTLLSLDHLPISFGAPVTQMLCPASILGAKMTNRTVTPSPAKRIKGHQQIPAGRPTEESILVFRESEFSLAAPSTCHVSSSFLASLFAEALSSAL